MNAVGIWEGYDDWIYEISTTLYDFVRVLDSLNV
jgi:hypothetical protein